MPRWPTGAWSSVAVQLAEERGETVHVGGIVSSDVFYDPDPDRPRRWAARGHLGIEMEAAVLYTIGALRGVATLAVLTVSDTLYGDRRRAHLRRRAAPGRGAHDRAGRSRGDRRFVV